MRVPWAFGKDVISYGLLCFGATYLIDPDGPGLMVLGFIVPLIWYLTPYGDEVRTERRRREILAERQLVNPGASGFSQ